MFLEDVKRAATASAPATTILNIDLDFCISMRLIVLIWS